MQNIIEKISKFGVIPVVVFNDVSEALPLAKALIDGGLPCAEITFRTDAAEESIRCVTKEYPEMFVGAGTVLTTEQVDRAVAAGAKFIVCPCFDSEVVDYCLSKSIPVFPGCITPSEVAQAVKRGLSVIKFFPAEQFGGLNTINAIAAPFPNVRFIPTGGVNLDNLGNYLKSPKVIACGGTWIAKANMLAKGNFDEIRDITKNAVEIVKESRN